jgi:hypothetical protein
MLQAVTAVRARKTIRNNFSFNHKKNHNLKYGYDFFLSMGHPASALASIRHTLKYLIIKTPSDGKACAYSQVAVLDLATTRHISWRKYIVVEHKIKMPDIKADPRVKAETRLSTDIIQPWVVA